VIAAGGGFCTTSGQRLHATSWWEASHVDEYLQNRALPIWASLTRLRTELYRDVGDSLVTQPALNSLKKTNLLNGHPLHHLEAFPAYLTKKYEELRELGKRGKGGS